MPVIPATWEDKPRNLGTARATQQNPVSKIKTKTPQLKQCFSLATLHDTQHPVTNNGFKCLGTRSIPKILNTIQQNIAKSLYGMLFRSVQTISSKPNYKEKQSVPLAGSTGPVGELSPSHGV